jgi:hypothetical protein
LNRQLPAGPWHARLTLLSGLNEADAQATLTFPPTSTSTGSTTPILAVVGCVALLLAAVALLAVVARSKKPKPATPAAPEPATQLPSRS